MPGTLRAEALDSLAATPDALGALVAGVPLAALEQAADGDWSAKDVLAHLVVSSRIGALARIRVIAVEDDPPLPDNDEDAELRRSGLRALPPAAILAEFAARRADDVAWLRTLDDAAFARGGRHSAVGRVTAEEFLYHAAYHDALHLAQLARMLGARFEPLRGAMRAF
jgi:DinB superfamily